MDKEDCIHVLLSALQKPQWKHSSSVSDWDLKNLLWKAGVLLTPEQASGLLADMKRRGLISGRQRRSDDHMVAMSGVRITVAGEDWLLQRALLAAAGAISRGSALPPASARAEAERSGEAEAEALERAPGIQEPIEAV